MNLRSPMHLALRAAVSVMTAIITIVIAVPALLIVMAAYALGELVLAPIRLGDPRSPDRRDEEDGEI